MLKPKMTSNSWKTNLTCSYCSQLYKNPIELPCLHTICSEHLAEKNVLKQNRISCVKCKLDTPVKENNFRPSRFLKRLLDDQVHLSSGEKLLKQKIEDSIRQFHQMYEDLISSKISLDIDCHSHFQEIRRQIDLQRESLKVKIDDIALIMIQKTNETEKLFLKSLNENYKACLESYEATSIGDDLKCVEKTFRNPNVVLIDEIQRLQIEQETKIDKIKLNLNEMTQIKEYLIKSNEFKSNLSFDQESFGLLQLNDFFKHAHFESQIVRGKLEIDLIKLCEFSLDDTWLLLYRGSRDGFSTRDFHAKCDGHANTLTVIKVKGKSFIFGAFTKASWDCSDKYKRDSNAFVFSLTNEDNQPCKMKICSHRCHSAIFCSSSYGPTFGGASDIYIANNANENLLSCSNLGDSFRHPRYASFSNEAKTFLAGSYYFQLSEIEVFQRI
jgi:hypothetical protein